MSEQERGRGGRAGAGAPSKGAQRAGSRPTIRRARGGGETDLALARALANARANVADAMETVRKTLGAQDAREDDGPLL